MADRVPLLGLLADALLPGEEHTLIAGALDPATFAALRKNKSKRVLALAIASSAELPTFVTKHVGTLAEVVSLTKDHVILRGLERARVLRAFATPPSAEIEPAPDATTPGLVLGALARLVEGSPAERAPELSVLLLRRAAPQSVLRAAMTMPLDDAARVAVVTADSSETTQSVKAQLDALRARKGKLTDEDKREISQLVHTLQTELDLLPKLEGGDALHGDVVSIERRLDAAGLPPDARDLARRQCASLRGMNKAHYDYATLVAHLELMASLPWSGPLSTPPPFEQMKRSLESQHFGLVRAKKRIVEYLAVRALGGAARGMVLCLAGPPGVGKTSLARSIAEGLGRKLIRVPLGGIHDEAEIRGHRRAFTNAGPGRILRGMRNAPRDPVLLLDEIDKIGTDTSRSASAALLEVLDPEQHHAFSDNFLGCGFDLSSVLFIATANDVEAIAPALKDRLELIELDGYTAQEKLVIAREHVLPRVRKDTGLPGEPPIDDAVLDALVAGWTREPGVRELQRALAALHRQRAVEHLAQDTSALTRPFDAAELSRVLGPARYRGAPVATSLPIGRAHGLSVGPEGGAVLPVEVLALPGKGELRLTGRQGEVMREAAETARSCVRARAAALGIDEAKLASTDLHVHLPDAAVKKEGPSAGVATFLAMVSALTRRALRGDVAITGEISLLGEVLPVGGVRAKVLAAERAGLAHVLLPEANRADVPDDARIPCEHVSRLDEALAFVLLSAR